MLSLPLNQINPDTFRLVYKIYTILTYKLVDIRHEYYELLETYPYPLCLSRGKLEQLESFLSQIQDEHFENCIVHMAMPDVRYYRLKEYVKKCSYYHEATVLIPTILHQIQTQVPLVDTDNIDMTLMNFKD